MPSCLPPDRFSITPCRHAWPHGHRMDYTTIGRHWAFVCLDVGRWSSVLSFVYEDARG